MSLLAPARVARRPTRSALASLVVASAAVIGTLGFSWVHPSSPVADEADGFVPSGVTVFDDTYPAVANLDPALLGALRRAATAAAGDGVDLYVNSGWRSAAYQERLLDRAVSKYGSRAEAARWVATPATSAHVAGKAVDIGHSDADTWLSEHGARYGLCQIYRNEPWHYELRPAAVDHGCPAMYADAAHDPRTSVAAHGAEAGSHDAPGELSRRPAA